jgi:hypothetical protein
MAHCPEIVNFVGLHFLNDSDEIGRIGKVSVMQTKMRIVDVRIFVEMIYTIGVEKLAAALNSVYFIPVIEQEFGKISSILSCNSCD